MRAKQNSEATSQVSTTASKRPGPFYMSEKKREIPFERVLFFCDATVAIAITLLALDLKLELPEGHHLTFPDLIAPWEKYLAFFLSFVYIATFWRRHHQMYTHIHKMNAASMMYNMGWLFFIVTLPFSTNVLSTHFGDAPAVFLYSMNSLAISLFQKLIWNSADRTEGFLNEQLSSGERKRFSIWVHLDIVNGLVCAVLALFVPKIAFFLLFFKIPFFLFATLYIARHKRIPGDTDAIKRDF